MARAYDAYLEQAGVRGKRWAIEQYFSAYERGDVVGGPALSQRVALTVGGGGTTVTPARTRPPRSAAEKLLTYNAQATAKWKAGQAAAGVKGEGVMALDTGRNSIAAAKAAKAAAGIKAEGVMIAGEKTVYGKATETIAMRTQPVYRHWSMTSAVAEEAVAPAGNISHRLGGELGRVAAKMEAGVTKAPATLAVKGTGRTAPWVLRAGAKAGRGLFKGAAGLTAMASNPWVGAGLVAGAAILGVGAGAFAALAGNRPPRRTRVGYATQTVGIGYPTFYAAHGPMSGNNLGTAGLTTALYNTRHKQH